MTKYDEEEQKFLVSCSECESEYFVQVQYSEREDEPSHCSFCGEKLDEYEEA